MRMKCWCHDPAKEPRPDCPLHGLTTKGFPMTANDQTSAALLPVTDADREAAARLIGETWSFPSQAVHDALSGARDDSPTVQAFARHRLAASPSPLPVQDAELVKAMDRVGIRKLEDNVRHYSGNEASGYAEINRRKAEAWDRIVALLT